MKVLITGGLGYIGSHLVQFLTNNLGYHVRILTLNIPPMFESWKKKYEILQCDVTCKKEIHKCCQGCNTVIHLASLDKIESQLNPDLAIKVSGIGTKNILEESVKSDVLKFIYFSTFHVYGIPKKKKVDENTLINPLNDYSLAHYAGELYCQQFRELHNLNTIVIRPSNGYGAPVHKDVNCWSLVVHDFCKSAIQQRKIVLKSEGIQKRDFISISDILQAIKLLLVTDGSKIKYHLYNLGSGVSYSIMEIAYLIKNLYEQLYHREIKIELASHLIPADFKNPFVLDISRIKEIGFKPKGSEMFQKEIRNIFRILESN